MDAFSRLLIDIREGEKMTQKKLSKILGISNTTLSRYERGQRHPHFNEMNRIIQVLESHFKDKFINIDKALPNLTFLEEQTTEYYGSRKEILKSINQKLEKLQSVQLTKVLYFINNIDKFD